MYPCNHVVSSISVDDSLRKRIKQIAAELDTSQGEVVAMGIEVLEETLRTNKSSHNHPGRKILKDSIDGNKELEWRSEIRKKLNEPGISIDEVIISSWGNLSED